WSDRCRQNQRSTNWRSLDSAIDERKRLRVCGRGDARTVNCGRAGSSGQRGRDENAETSVERSADSLQSSFTERIGRQSCGKVVSAYGIRSNMEKRQFADDDKENGCRMSCESRLTGVPPERAPAF